MYTDTVMDHFQNPRNAGELEQPDGIGTVGNPECGDITRVYLKVSDGRIVDVRFKTFGCAAAIASGSIATEMIRGKTLADAEALTRDNVADALGGLPEKKMHCSNIASDAIRAAIEDYRTRQTGTSNGG